MLKKIFGSHSARELKRIYPIADKVDALEPEIKALSDTQLRAKTDEFRKRLANGETLDDILPEAFAVCREAGWRALGQRAFRSQIIGGIVLHQGRIAEMKTGEGKTLVATLPAYLNALAGKGVHVVTVNEYLAKFQSEWMGKLYRFLGLEVGLIIQSIRPEDRHAAYVADITYGTNNEFGFDYLRDNLKVYKEEMVQRGHHFAIVDEVDSILVDEARTPLIISTQGEKSSSLYETVDQFARALKKLTILKTETKQEYDDVDADYIVDEKAKTATLTANGIAKAEKRFAVENLSDGENTTLLHHINQAIHARGVKKRDVDYVVRDGEVVIVDEFTGRLMFGRRYNEGLHQAIEAKEGVTVENENRTGATVTFQNYFRLYTKLSGMTGTATTEADEFMQIYKLDVVEIPTNKPMIRQDLPDLIFKNEAGKLRAIIAQILDCHKRGQPVLVGTVSIEKSELVSRELKKAGLKDHVVLNAKHHEKEAEIVAQAGRLGAVTIATNMAGRGTDIILGGNSEYAARLDLRKELSKRNLPEEMEVEATGYADTTDENILAMRSYYAAQLEYHKKAMQPEAEQVRQAGGLYIIGTERHDSRRIDNQLRGRAGRQGDAGTSRFYLAGDDDIMRLYGGERMAKIFAFFRMDEDTPLESKMVTKGLENAQKTVESRNFQSRKYVLEYDDVMNQQRELIYGQRKKVLDGDDIRSSIETMVNDWVVRMCQNYTDPQGYYEDTECLEQTLQQFENVLYPKGTLKPEHYDIRKEGYATIADAVYTAALKFYDEKERRLTPELMREMERVVLLKTVDRYWMDHLDAMHELRRGIGLRSYAQTDPIVAYKQEGFEMFDGMINAIREEVVRGVFSMEVQGTLQRQRVAKVLGEGFGGDGSVKKSTTVRKVTTPGPNEPCPCGSGKKNKMCCRVR